MIVKSIILVGTEPWYPLAQELLLKAFGPQVLNPRQFFIHRPQTMLEVLELSVHDYELLLVDQEVLLKKKLFLGLDRYIHALNQTPKILALHRQSLIQFFPLKRFSEEEFMQQRPWESLPQGTRRYFRFPGPIPVVVLDGAWEGQGSRTVMGSLSLAGCSLHYGLPEQTQSTLELQFTGVPNSIVAQIKWSTPWGPMGEQPQVGLSFQLDSYAQGELAHYLKREVIPSLLKRDFL